MFRQEYFNLLDKYQDVARNKEDDEQNKAYEILKDANNLTKVWAEGLIKKSFPQGYLGHFKNRPTNQANKFKPYTWAKIYPKKNAPKGLAYTVGIEADYGFVVKIDTVGDVGAKRNQYETLRGGFDGQSPIISMLPIEGGINKSLDELVDWSVQEIQKFKLTYENLCTQLELDDEQDSDFENRQKAKPIKALVEQDMSSKEHSLNRILYGAAGTGKTYNTINHALSIIQGVDIADLDSDRQVLKKEFDQLKDQGRIKFVTFHQSFSYEDFVEGIRAETDEETGQLIYPVRDGVFKEVCRLATGKQKMVNSVDGIVLEFLEQITEQPIELQTQNAKPFIVSYSGEGLTVKCKPMMSEYEITHKANIKYIKQLLSGEEIGKVYNSSYVYAISKYLEKKLYVETRLESGKTNPYVLIIDEINRGNISRIFGELITLIEDSKRKGATEALSVTLPYSKEEFFVPQNLYIIGTMNSSDRSLTGLDIALRRRFTFIEMPPKPSLIQDENKQPLYIKAKNKDGNNDKVNIVRLLEVMNQRIEVLLDRDHCIGHANFMSLKSDSKLDELAQIFKQKIIPQLQEYFFDDWSKIDMVLNKNGMLEAEAVKTSEVFPNINTDEVGYFEEQKIWELNEEAFESIESFTKIIKH